MSDESKKITGDAGPSGNASPAPTAPLEDAGAAHGAGKNASSGAVSPAGRMFFRSSGLFHRQYIEELHSFNELPLLRAIRYGLMLVMPLLFASALVLLINNFPLSGYQTAMQEIFGPNWKEPGAAIYTATIGIMALLIAISLSDSLMDLHNTRNPDRYMLPILGMLTSFSCLFIVSGVTWEAGGLVLPWAGIRGIFGSLITTFLACWLLMFFSRFPALRLRFYSEGADSILPHIFDSLLPVLGTIGVFVLLRCFLSHAGVESLHQVLYDVIHNLFAGAQDSFALGALYALLVHVAWFFGIHGADLFDPVTHDILMQGMELNSIALNRHEVPTHIITKYLYDVYVNIGGCGASIGLLLAIFLRSREQGVRRVASISVIPAMFNINELLVFGLPIILNVAFLIPFVLVPLLLFTVSYFAISLGIAPMPVYQVDWITPPIINAFISTESWRGVALQLFNIGLATAVYVPFVAFAEQSKIRNRRKTFIELAEIALSGSRSASGKRCIDLPGATGALARSLVNDMTRSLMDYDESIKLYYQPRVNIVNRTIPCVEALLRWNHPFYGMVPAVLTLAIAEDAGLTDELDRQVVRMAFEQQGEWRKRQIYTTISLNLSERQLLDKELPDLLQRLYSLYNIPAGSIMLEVREQLALDSSGRFVPALKALHETGAMLALDDFGNAHTSLSLLKTLPLSELQIDRSLITSVVDNKLNQDVVGSIQEMCFDMGIKTSAEYVESPEQLETLLELNVSTFQGYYFSQPVAAEECGEFILSFTESQQKQDTD